MWSFHSLAAPKDGVAGVEAALVHPAVFAWVFPIVPDSCAGSGKTHSDLPESS